MKTNKAQFGVYLSWFILVTFYLYQYVLRNSPGVLIEDIRQQYHMNADEFAFMGSMFYYGYSCMQIPLGLLVDRVGIRFIALASISLCAFGILLLTLTHYPALAYLSRLLIGIGAAFAFMSSIKLASDYLPPEKQGVAIGATLSFGAAGALLTGAPLNYLLQHFNWQTSFHFFAFVGVLIFILAFIYLPKKDKQSESSAFDLTEIKQSILAILTNKKIWVYSIIAIGLYTPLAVMADLWGTAFIVKKFNLTREVASPILMNIYIGMAIGSIALPYLAEKYKILDRIIQFSALMLLILFSSIIYLPDLSKDTLVILLILIGFFCGAEMLCFTAALREVTPNTSGMTIGVVNTLNMLSAALMQHAIGVYLDFTWHGDLDQRGLRIYSSKEFVEAFSILVIIISICAIIALFALRNNKVKYEA